VKNLNGHGGRSEASAREPPLSENSVKVLLAQPPRLLDTGHYLVRRVPHEEWYAGRAAREARRYTAPRWRTGRAPGVPPLDEVRSGRIQDASGRRRDTTREIVAPDPAVDPARPRLPGPTRLIALFIAFSCEAGSVLRRSRRGLTVPDPGIRISVGVGIPIGVREFHLPGARDRFGRVAAWFHRPPARGGRKRRHARSQRVSRLNATD